LSLDKNAIGSLDKALNLKLASLSVDTINEKTSASGVTIDGVKLKDSQPYCDVINEKTAGSGVTIDGAKLKDNLVEANLKDGVTIGGDPITKIATGTYTGDGTTAKAITGVGFQPKVVWISNILLVDDQNIMGVMWKVLGQHTTTFADMHNNAGDKSYDRKITIDADGFTVDDDDADQDPNTNAEVYYYICLG